MSDERLRDLERAWRRTRSVDDEAAFLRERVRVGELEDGRVGLAAWLGHPAAEQLAGPAAAFVAPRRGTSASETFWRGVLAHGEQAAVRAIVAETRRATRRVTEALTRGQAQPTRALTRLRAIVAPDGLTGDPPEREASGWWRAIMRIVESATSWVLAPGDEAREVLARDLDRVAVGRIPPALFEARPRPVGAAVSDLARGLEQLEATLAGVRPGSDRDPWRGMTVERLSRLRATMCAEVAPWALGTGDALRDELQGRLDRIQIASPCTAAWDLMTPIGVDGRTRRCATCDLAVHDLAAYSAAEVDALLRQREDRRLCVNLYRRADGRILTRDCPTGLSDRVSWPGVTTRGGIA